MGLSHLRFVCLFVCFLNGSLRLFFFTKTASCFALNLSEVQPAFPSEKVGAGVTAAPWEGAGPPNLLRSKGERHGSQAAATDTTRQSRALSWVQ